MCINRYTRGKAEAWLCMSIDGVLPFKIARRHIPASRYRAVWTGGGKKTVFGNNPLATIRGRKIFWKINSRTKRTMGIVFFRVLRVHVCYVRVFASRVRAISPPRRAPRAVRGGVRPRFSVLCGIKVFSREFICWHRNERTTRASVFSGG